MAASIPPSADQLLSQAADDEHTVVATDPTGRYERFNKCLGMGAYKKVRFLIDCVHSHYFTLYLILGIPSIRSRRGGGGSME